MIQSLFCYFVWEAAEYVSDNMRNGGVWTTKEKRQDDCVRKSLKKMCVYAIRRRRHLGAPDEWHYPAAAPSASAPQRGDPLCCNSVEAKP